MLYISVESRKGGVGKTTTALTLAETLLSKGYEVLMFDLDIVGTTIDTSFINSNKHLIHEVKLNRKAVNIVHFFKEVYMAGKNIPAFVLEKENKAASLSYERGKCNFIGSNIYDTPKGIILLEDPRVLYDAFHAYWLLEFVKDISNSFKAALGKDNKVAIILDNSPGFSSIENRIHEYLTDLGPEAGKVLLVSTIDPQDIEACRQSKSVIETLFHDKVAAGEYYRSMIERGDGQKRKSLAFEYVWNSLCASNGQEPTYYSSNHDAVSLFVNVLVNKVPRIIFEQLFTKGILNKESEVAVPFVNHLLYYFSNPLLSAREIEHLQVYTNHISQYSQSGKVENINSDDAKYTELCKAFHQNGQGDFFKSEWAPLAPFRDLVEILKGQDALKKRLKWKISLCDNGFVSKDSTIVKEVEAVQQFVLSNIRGTAHIKNELPSIVEFVTSVLKELDENAQVDFHPEHPKLQEIGDFVTSFGLAAYRLHVYELVCKLFNILMRFCLENVENIEKLNKDSISTWLANVLEGRISTQGVTDTLVRMLEDRRNARELSEALQVIIRSWEL